MTKKSGKSLLATKLGSKGKKAFDEHRNEDTTYSAAGDLPAGIEGGIAKLVKCDIGVYKKGENKGGLFFMASGVVVEPVEHQGEIIQGRRTNLGPWGLFDNPKGQGKYKTLNAQVARMLNELRKLGADGDDLSIETAEETAQDLVDAGVYFKFRTWIGQPTEKYPNPQVNHQWAGHYDYEEETSEDVEDDTEDESDDATTDDSTEDSNDLVAVGKAADNDEDDAQALLTEKAEAAGIDSEEYDDWVGVAQAIMDKTGSEDNEEDGKEDSEKEYETSLQDLGDQADDEDEDAIEKLTEKAEEVEIDPDDYDDWASLATALVKARESSEEEEDDDVEPAIGEVWMYTPPKKKKAIECEVKKVNTKKKTVSLENLDDEKVYKAVPWSELTQE